MKDHFVAFGGSMRCKSFVIHGTCTVGIGIWTDRSCALACVGQHLARLELLFALQTFFRECPDVVMAKSADEKCMERLDFFTAKPRSGKVEVTRRQGIAI